MGVLILTQIPYSCISEKRQIRLTLNLIWEYNAKCIESLERN